MSLVDQVRNDIRQFLIEYGTRSKKEIIRRAKEKGIFPKAEGDEDLYDSLLRFGKYHDIKIEEREEIKFTPSPKVEFIETVDENGNASLKRIGSDKVEAPEIKKALESERDRLAKQLLLINNLIKHYE